ncbi:MAG: nucleotidyl transferase AbiEii/AbiGii toxin family protein [Planctomycetota bacterium]|jgi:predicted nucleotidyltransferase component of viral defense system
MFNKNYERQVELLIRCLPSIDKYDCFAIKGGTAINLFHREMPRLSVDIDLAFLPLKSREESFLEISKALLEIGTDIENSIPGVQITSTYTDKVPTKLIITGNDIQIKIEVNLVLRGCVFEPEKRELCKNAQEQFEQHVIIKSLSTEDLYGGKICATLDRQHPRDLFDIMLLLDEEGITPGIRKAFVVYLAGHSRPMNELLSPKLKDLGEVFVSQFSGMSLLPVSLPDLYSARDELIAILQTSLSDAEKTFLLSIKKGSPDWEILGIDHLDKLPALQWKLINISKMNKKKHAEELQKLVNIL